MTLAEPLRYALHVGDPTVIGWVITGAYAVATLSAAAAAARLRGTQDGRVEARFWGAAAVALALLGANKQLDLQVLVSELGRRGAEALGLAHGRRLIQLAVTLLAVAVGVPLMARLFGYVRGARRPVRLAVLGLGMVGLFVALRALTFAHLGRILPAPWLFENEPLKDALELGGVLLALAGALLAAGARPRPQ